jgi:hypothetical protein
MKFLSRVEIESGIGPEVRDRARQEDSVPLALQKEIAGRGHAARAGAKKRGNRIRDVADPSLYKAHDT